MGFEICAITADNLPELHRVVSAAFGEEATAERVDDERLTVEYDRMIGVADGGQLVAGAGAYSFDLTLPGGDAIPMAGVTWVGCVPSHRRQGILTMMMGHQLDDVAARGEAIAGLTASEAVIYGRFGYGVASHFVEATVRKSRKFLVEPEVAGRTRYVWGDETGKVLPPIFDEWRRQRPGAINRSDGRWQAILLDRPHHRGGASAAFYVVHEDGQGRPDGYVVYRVKQGDGDHTVIVSEVIAIDPEVEAALWRFMLDLDLARKFELPAQPVDSQVPWRLADQRSYHSGGLWDFLWLRVMDTAAALAARSYATSDALVLDVVDPFRPDGAAAGRFRLEGGPDGATCVPEKSADADVTLSVESLGSAYLGGVRWSTLATAGRVDATPDVLKRADAMFTSTPLPFCNTGF